MNWEKIWSDHWEEIYVFVYIRVRHKQEAEDITQEAFIRAIRSEHRYLEENVNVAALLKTISKNLIIDRWRKKRKDQDHLPLIPDLYIKEEGVSLERWVEQKEEVTEALSLLNEEQRKVIVYRLLQGLSIKETAELLGRNETFVKVTQFRAIKKVKTLLEKQYRDVEEA